MLKKVIFTVAFVAVVAAAAWSAHMVTSPEVKPQDPIANAKSLIAQGNSQEALSMLKKALSNGAQSESVHQLIADISLKSDDYSTAQHHYEEALKLDGKNAQALVGLGLIDLKQQNVNGAIQKFTLAMRADPLAPEPYFHMGNLALGSGKADVAMNFYRKSLSIDPNYVPAQQVVQQMTQVMQQAMASQAQKK